jgi:hypothetical protein
MATPALCIGELAELEKTGVLVELEIFLELT